MSWEVFKVRFRIESPIHIGHYTIGILKKTRYYILGKNMWGAMTEKLALSDNNHDFRKIGEIVANNLIFSYLYLEDPKGGKLLKPRFTNDGLKYGDYNVYEFEKRFVRSFVSTAIESNTMSAERESLHETEFISNRVLAGKEKGKEVYVVGYLFTKNYKNGNYPVTVNDNGICINGYKFCIGDEITIGGERKYGFGRLRLESFYKIDDEKFVLNREKPIISYYRNESIDSHLYTNNRIKLRGELEILSGKEYGARGYGRKSWSTNLAWVPGSILESNYLLEICEYGILRCNNTLS